MMKHLPKRTGIRFPASCLSIPFALLLVCAAHAQQPEQTSSTPPTWEEPMFFVEAIEIDGLKRASTAPLLTQLRLIEGRSYGEDELRRAIFRIKRLAFVYDAQMSLQKGSERGRYILHIEVIETTRYFVVYDGAFRYRPSETFTFDLSQFGDPELTGIETYKQESTFDTEGDHLTAGGRWFLGPNGMAFATVNPDGASVGYTHYNLFGSHSFATVGVRKAICCGGSGATRENDFGISIVDDVEVSLAVGVPVAVDHSLQLNLTWANGDDTEDSAGIRWDLSHDSRGIDLRWFYDTTDDPFFPTRGSRTSAGGGYFETELESSFPDFAYSSRSEDLAASLSLVRYFDRGKVGVFWTGADFQWIDSDKTDDVDQEFFFGDEPFRFVRTIDLRAEASRATGTLGWAKDLLPDNRGKTRELRLETDLDFSWIDRHRSRNQFLPDIDLNESDHEIQFTVGVAFRNRWSVVRLGVGYLDGPRR